jgi:hypothetical protein
MEHNEIREGAGTLFFNRSEWGKYKNVFRKWAGDSFQVLIKEPKEQILKVPRRER